MSVTLDGSEISGEKALNTSIFRKLCSEIKLLKFRVILSSVLQANSTSPSESICLWPCVVRADLVFFCCSFVFMVVRDHRRRGFAPFNFLLAKPY